MTDSDDYGGLLPLSITWSLVAGGAFAATYVALRIVGLDGIALLASAFASVFILISRTYWNFRDKQWFLACSAGFLLIHAVAIFVFQLPKISAPTLLIVFPIILADFFAMLALYWFAKSRF